MKDDTDNNNPTLMQTYSSKKHTTEPPPRKCSNCGKDIPPFSLNVWGETRWYPGTCECEKQCKIEEKQAQQEAERQEHIQQLFDKSFLTPKLRQQTFQNRNPWPGTEKALHFAYDMAHNFKQYQEKKQGLLITGEPGNGKTFLASCVANELIQQSYSVIFQNVEDMLDRIRATYNRTDSDESERKVMHSLTECDLLILDDLAVIAWSTDWPQGKIYQIIDRRHRTGKPIIATTNCDASLLQKRISKRTYDRLHEMCISVKNDGKSYRREIAQQRILDLKGGALK